MHIVAALVLSLLAHDRAREPERTRAVRRVAGERPAEGNLVLVTHGANILALSGIRPAPGEFLVLTPEAGGTFRVAGRLTPAALRSP